jgi:hypothetical protein
LLLQEQARWQAVSCKIRQASWLAGWGLVGSFKSRHAFRLAGCLLPKQAIAGCIAEKAGRLTGLHAGYEAFSRADMHSGRQAVSCQSRKDGRLLQEQA